MRIKIRTLHPVHIGSGAEVMPNEYLVDENRLHRIDMEGLVADPDFKPMMDTFIKSAMNTRYLGDLVNHNLLKRHVLYTLPLVGDAQSHLATNTIAIKAHIKTAGRVFLPGSSVKGVLLSALICKALVDMDRAGRFNFDSDINDKKQPDYEDLLAKALGNITGRQSDRFVRWADVSDSNALDVSECLEIRMARVIGSESKKSLPIVYECIKPGVEFELEIRPQKCRYQVKDILELADKYYRKVAQKDGSAEVDNDRYLLRLGQGATVYSTSLINVASMLDLDYKKVKEPKTRKLIDSKIPLGWAEAELL